MNPLRIWLGLLFVALGLFGILDVTGTLDWEASVGQWWPLAVIAFGLAEMASCRRVTLGPAIITTIGVGCSPTSSNGPASGSGRCGGPASAWPSWSASTAAPSPTTKVWTERHPTSRAPRATDRADPAPGKWVRPEWAA